MEPVKTEMSLQFVRYFFNIFCSYLFTFEFAYTTESLREGVTERDPLFLNEALESVDGAEVWIHDQLGQ